MANTGKTKKGTVAMGDVDSARLSDEAPHPVMRVGAKGETLYANAFCDTLEGWLEPKTRKLAKEITKKAVECFKKNEEMTMEYKSSGRIFVNSLTPVPGQDYVNIYGLDVTNSREADKQLADLAKFPDENPNPILRVKPDGNILFANDAAYNMTEIFENEAQEKLSGNLRRAAEDAKRDGNTHQKRVETNGETFLLTLIPITDEGYLNVYGRSITAEREAQ
jgi:PAS domain-containing protein